MLSTNSRQRIYGNIMKYFIAFFKTIPLNYWMTLASLYSFLTVFAPVYGNPYWYIRLIISKHLFNPWMGRELAQILQDTVNLGVMSMKGYSTLHTASKWNFTTRWSLVPQLGYSLLLEVSYLFARGYSRKIIGSNPQSRSFSRRTIITYSIKMCKTYKMIKYMMA